MLYRSRSGCGLRGLPMVVTVSPHQEPGQGMGSVSCSVWAWSLHSGVLRGALPVIVLAPVPLSRGQHSPPSALRARLTAPKHGFSAWHLATPGRWQPKEFPHHGGPSLLRERRAGARRSSPGAHAGLVSSPQALCPPSLFLCQMNENLTRPLKHASEPQAK